MMKDLKVIVDNRERNLDIIEGLSNSKVQVSFAQLPVGDYIISDRVCVERKTVSDFESSIINNRLFEQLDRLHASFQKPILIVEGDDLDFRLGDNVRMGTVLSLYLNHNIQMVRSKDATETAWMLAKFAEREQDSKEKEPRIAGLKKAHTRYEWQVLILGSLPGVGPKLAHKLIARFKTLKGVVSATTDELQEVDKIGKKKAATIFELLNAEFEETGGV